MLSSVSDVYKTLHDSETIHLFICLFIYFAIDHI